MKNRNKKKLKTGPSTSITVKSEEQTKKDLLYLAKHQGCEMELRQVYERYERLLKNNPDSVSRKQIAVMGITEIHRLLNVRGGLAVLHVDGNEVIGGEQLIPHDPALDEAEKLAN